MRRVAVLPHGSDPTISAQVAETRNVSFHRFNAPVLAARAKDMTLDSQPNSPSITDGSYASHEAVLQLFTDITDRFATATSHMDEGMTPKQWELISAVESTGEVATLTHLGAILGCSRQNVKKLALAIEKRELVSLISGHNNAIHIEITEYGKGVLERIRQRRKAILAELFEPVSNEEFATLRRTLDVLNRNVEERPS